MITNSKDFNRTTYLLKFTQDLEKQEDSSASLTKADLRLTDEDQRVDTTFIFLQQNCLP